MDEATEFLASLFNEQQVQFPVNADTNNIKNGGNTNIKNGGNTNIDPNQTSVLDTDFIKVSYKTNITTTDKKSNIDYPNNRYTNQRDSIINEVNENPKDMLVILGLGPSQTKLGIEQSLFNSNCAFEKVILTHSKLGIIKFFSSGLLNEFITRVGTHLVIDGCNCRLDYYKQKVINNDAEYVNCGSRDVGTINNNVILVRNIAVNLFPKVLYDLVLEIIEPRKIVYINSKSSHEFLGFGFIIFHTERDANNFIEIVNNTKINRPIVFDDRELLFNYAHKGSFIPSLQGVFGDNGQYLKYWDEGTFCETYPRETKSIEHELTENNTVQQPLQTNETSIPWKPSLDEEKVPNKAKSQLQQWNQINNKLNQELEARHLEIRIEESKSYKDVENLICLLCKRRFLSINVLDKHIAESTLHIRNLELLKIEHIQPNLKNVGEQMMEKMGWSKGQGLGLDSKGIKQPLLPKKRPDKLGLGSHK